MKIDMTYTRNHIILLGNGCIFSLGVLGRFRRRHCLSSQSVGARAISNPGKHVFQSLSGSGPVSFVICPTASCGDGYKTST